MTLPFEDGTAGWTGTSTSITTAGTGMTFIVNNMEDLIANSTPLANQKGVQAIFAAAKSKTTKGISATLLFKFVKSKLTKLQQQELKKRLSKLASLLKYSEEMQQWAVYEESAKKILEITREQEADLLGIDKFVMKKDVEKFIYSVREKIVKLKEFSEFPRIVPVRVQKRLKELQVKGLFDEYWILYTDLTAPAEEIKSNKQRIKEKDPILFGKFNNVPDKLYYIADWIDEYCDLTFDKLTDKLANLDPEYQVDFIEDISPKYVARIKKEILDKQARLKATKQSNYKDLMKEEDGGRNKKSWLKKLIYRFF